MKPEQVLFSLHPRPFRVSVLQCTKPGCPCSEVTFDLVEVVEADLPAETPLRLQFNVDPNTWLEVSAPERPPAQARMIAEFLADYPARERSIFQGAIRKKQRIARCLRDCRFDSEALAGNRLVSFHDVISEAHSEGTTEFLDQYRNDDHTYLITDLYCANPDCLCDEVHLDFLLFTPPREPGGPAKATSHFTASVSLNGVLKIEKSVVGTDAQSNAIAKGWWQTAGDLLDELTWRYEKIKEIGRRSVRMDSMRVSAASPGLGGCLLSSHVEPGRNDPCPCGSGKKYKKCCGR